MGEVGLDYPTTALLERQAQAMERIADALDLERALPEPSACVALTPGEAAAAPPPIAASPSPLSASARLPGARKGDDKPGAYMRALRAAHDALGALSAPQCDGVEGIGKLRAQAALMVAGIEGRP